MIVTPWNGKPISQPGWYSGIPIDRYHGPGICDAPAVSSSNLRTAWAKSPKHAHLYWAENPQREIKEPSNAMLLGAVAHHLLLGEDAFKLKYITYPLTYRDKKTAIEKPWHNGAGYCKAWTERAVAAGKIPIVEGFLDTVVQMARSLKLEPLVDEGLLNGHIECSGFAKDEQTGIWIKVRPDVVPMSGPDFVDLKTANEVTTVALQSSIRSYGYHQQGALIWEACELLGQPFLTFLLMFAETSAPFCTRTVGVSDLDLERGRLMNGAMLRKFRQCIDEDRWPGPGEGELRELPLGNDERDRIDRRLQFEGVTS